MKCLLEWSVTEVLCKQSCDSQSDYLLTVSIVFSVVERLEKQFFCLKLIIVLLDINISNENI